MNAEKQKSKRQIVDWEIDSVSLVARCPYCGSSETDEPVEKEDGSICNHPTSYKIVKPVDESKQK